ncbi:MAG TPA: BamA/TamA family outer membrane protein, partial [Gemmatimonadales bacterium]|nr:BamA/TamA family outer membrane protein [Gemmatimonadales bacterium]
FSGFGNETPAPAGRFADVDQWQFVLSPVIVHALSSRSRVEAGPVLKYAADGLHGDHVLDRDRPLGAAGFGRLGLQGSIAVGGLDDLELDESGFGIALGGSLFGPVWSADEPFGELHLEAVSRMPLRLGLVPVLALRVGGKRVWGAFPYDEAAFLGGQRSIRGYDYQRFAGEASLYGSAELRVPLARVLEHSVPTRIGVFALGDAGRVWADGDRSRVVHAAAGGGLWLSFFEDRHTVSLAAASGAEGTRWYVRSGLAF